MLTMRTEAEGSKPKSNLNPVVMEGTPKPKASLYEQCREERIKENLQRMQNLGLLNLSLQLKSKTRQAKRPYGNSNSAQKPTTPLQPSRRSSRLEKSSPVIYTDGVNEKGKRESVVIGEGPRTEVYTEGHEKLLGNTERSWTCFVDGYDKDGKRIYDPFKGKTCHQCRYGEHVLEALENPKWVCPVCRGICNCSMCRNHKGWVPTGPIYRRIAKLGYKSVAHYLIQTKRSQTDDATPNQASAKRSLSFQEATSLPKIAAADDDHDHSEQVVQNGDYLKKEEDENTNENPDSARRSLSFFLPSLDDQTSLVDVQLIDYPEPPKQDKQDHSCTNIGDGLPRIQERTGQNSNSDTRADCYLFPGENQTIVLDAQDKIQCNETDIESTSVSTRETRSKRKASLEPNPDSIGGRLRQRRTSQSGL
ncbi:unnamed protein product [Arabis nemorensis]|uniref:Zinc-finger domain-containing protein n=1 Tax=Arabis nemorensis TaxID=586526 RepID=A0A565CXJ1_9BRAS|nr:unnamed protein product [Arabis nemorensis]